MQFSLPTATVDLLLISRSKSKQVDTDLLSEIEVITEVNLFKKHRVTGPDGLFPSFFKGLTKLGLI